METVTGGCLGFVMGFLGMVLVTVAAVVCLLV